MRAREEIEQKFVRSKHEEEEPAIAISRTETERKQTRLEE